MRGNAASSLDSGIDTLVWMGNSITSSESSPEFNFQVSKIAYNKRVYHPGEVHVTMTVTTTDTTKAIDFALLQKSSKATFMPKDGTHISLVGTRNADPQSTQEVDWVYIAKHYYVQSLSFSMGGGTTSIIIHAYSPDKKLTYDKYCNAYTGKKFGENILSEELGEKGIFQKCQIPFTFQLENLQRLQISGVELCQPYLVQYNESFYDFICRVANRCGEFLFYENGTLTLGLDLSDTNNIKDIGASTIYNCPEIDDGGSAIATVDFYSDYTKEKNDKKNDNVAEKCNYYNGETGADEYFREITGDDNIPYTDIINLWVLFSAMASGFQGDDFTDLITNMVKDAAANVANGGIVWRAVHDDYKDDYIDKNPDFTRVKEKVIDMLSTVYHTHAKEEERVTRNLIELDFQASLSPLMLGDVIMIGGQKHVVTCLQGHYDSTGSTTDIHNRAEAIPFASDGKPIPPVGRVPHILKASPQEAIVASTDDPLRLGRVRITYLWQQSGKVKTKDDEGKEGETELNPAKSPWIRVAVPFAGGLGGMVMTPEKDSHVMVNYIDNNMERPYVDGALYYADQKPPTGSVLLNNKSFQPKANRRVIASASGHSISFLDGKGVSNFVAGLVPPIGQMWNLVKGSIAIDEKDDVRGGDKPTQTDSEDQQFYGGMVLRDSNDIYNISMSTHGRSISISSPFGKVDINAFTGITINAPNGDVKIKGKNISLEAGNNISIVAGKNIRPKKSGPKETVGAMVGSIFGNLAAQILVEQSKNFLGFDPTKLTDVSFLRSMWEVLMRPVEGTLSIKSNRNVTMTAGKGKAMIPTSLMSQCAPQGWMNKMNEDEKAAKDLGSDIQRLLEYVESKIDSFYAAHIKWRKKIKKVSTLLFECLRALTVCSDRLSGNGMEILKNLIDKPDVESMLESAVTIRRDRERLSLQVQANDGEGVFKGVFKSNIIQKYVNDFNMYYDYPSFYYALLVPWNQDKLLQDINELLDPDLQIAWDNNWTLFAKSIDLPGGCKNILDVESIPSDCKGMKRKVFVAILKKCDDQIKLPHEPGALYSNDDSWSEFINGIEFTNKPKAEDASNSGWKAFGAELPSVFGDAVEFDEDGKMKTFDSIKKLFNINGCAGPRATWDVVGNGNILVSNSAQHTYQLNSESSGWEPVLNAGLNGLKEYLKKH